MDSPPHLPERNAEQIDYWNGVVGERWALLQDRLDRLFADLTAAAIDEAAPEPGTRGLDIGCGCGASLLALARKVGPSGSVLGVDVSRPMLDVAAERTAALPQVRLLLADAAAHDFAAPGFDFAFSRFGVMFFDAPAEAFANIRQALRPGARLFFTCWQAFAENPLWTLPYGAAKPHVPLQPPQDPAAPGPFAFGSADRVHTILSQAGFGSIKIEPRDFQLQLAASGDLDAAFDLVAQIGPASRALASASPHQRLAAEVAIRAALAEQDGPQGIRLAARLWFVAAVA